MLLRSSLLGLVLVAFASGCAVETASSEPAPEESTSDLSLSKVKLPLNDPCRDVLAPLAMGLADGAAGLPWTKSITVSLVSETEYRSYVAAVARTDGSTIKYDVELDNDSH